MTPEQAGLNDMTGRHECPRRAEVSYRRLPGDAGIDDWTVRRDDEHPGIINNGRRCCSYCGSLHPDDFMAAVREGAQIGPTDKSYKAYIEWPEAPISRGNFYYQHLSEEQRIEFLELLKAGSINIGVPGYFYVLPFFVRRAD